MQSRPGLLRYARNDELIYALQVHAEVRKNWADCAKANDCFRPEHAQTFVIPAKAGIQSGMALRNDKQVQAETWELDSRLRGNDENEKADPPLPTNSRL
jgi:hypothetical protein